MLWPTHTEKKKRAKRGMMDGGSGTHDVSAETALMTISILTFAVFLIKLVLVGIEIYRNFDCDPIHFYLFSLTASHPHNQKQAFRIQWTANDDIPSRISYKSHQRKNKCPENIIFCR